MPNIQYDKDNAELTAICRDCKKIVRIPCTARQWSRFRNGELIQSVFPKVSADDREVFLSGMCGKCFDKIFEGMEDYE